MRNFAPDLRRGNLTSPDMIAFTKLFTVARWTASRLSNSRAISTTATGVGRWVVGERPTFDWRSRRSLCWTLSDTFVTTRIFSSCFLSYFWLSLSRAETASLNVTIYFMTTFRFIRMSFRDVRHVGRIRFVVHSRDKRTGTRDLVH